MLEAREEERVHGDDFVVKVLKQVAVPHSDGGDDTSITSLLTVDEGDAGVDSVRVCAAPRTDSAFCAAPALTRLPVQQPAQTLKKMPQ